MSLTKVNGYNKLATRYFELKKVYDKIGNKPKAKYFKKLMEKYDQLAYKEALRMKLPVEKLYMEQVVKGTALESRADRLTRYYHYRQWHTATLDEKVRWGIELVKESLKRAKHPVVSCSFGIDSIVTLYIVRKALEELGRDPSEIEIIWNDTLNEFPEVRIYANQLRKDWNLNLQISKPKMPLKKIIEKHGGVDSSYFFTRKGDRRNGLPLSEKCCGTLKHEPMKRAIKENTWDLVLNGLRSDESTQRLRAGLRDGEYFYSNTEWKAFVCRPIMWMTEEDIWDYVEQENIPYNDLYNKNTIMKYPENNEELVDIHIDKLNEFKVDVEMLRNRQLLNVTRKQSILLKKIGYNIFTPRTGWKAAV